MFTGIDKQFVRDKVESPYNIKDASNTKENIVKRSSSHSSDFMSRSPERHLNPSSTVTTIERKQSQISTPLINTRTRSHDNGKKTPSTSNDMSMDYITPTRKRKFPGPAGVLPKLVNKINFFNTFPHTRSLLPKTLNTYLYINLKKDRQHRVWVFPSVSVEQYKLLCLA